MVENWVTHPAEPTMLLLAWQPPDDAQPRSRWAVGAITPLDAEGRLQLRYFGTGIEFDQWNGRPFEHILALGYQGHPAFNRKRRIHSEGVAETLLRRLPPRQRPDFANYCRQFRLPADLNLSNFGLLGRTEAKVPGDNFSLVDPLDANTVKTELMLEIAGYRHHVHYLHSPLSVGEEIHFVPEPDNIWDKNAVKVVKDASTIGYLNRFQAKAFSSWLSNRRVSAVVERLNGSADRPKAFMFVEVRPALLRVAA